MKLAIWLPTYGRPGKLAEVAKNIEETTHNPFTLYFGVEKSDKASIKAAKATGHTVIVNKYEQGYSNTIQSIYEATNDEFWFFANDDFYFLTNWDKIPIEVLEEDEKIQVVGCHDGNPATSFKTICMVRRKYIDEMSGVIDMPKRVFYPYHHNFIDTEFTETAQFRGVWDAVADPCIEHHHHSLKNLFDKDIEYDETYKKNDEHVSDDARTFFSRTHLWS